MTADEKAAHDAAVEWMARYKERKDHAMEYWAYERDAKAFAQFILTGRYNIPEPASSEPKGEGYETADNL